MMSDSSYPTIKHRWLHNDLQYAIYQLDAALKSDPSDVVLPVIKSIITRALERYEEIISSPTRKRRLGDEG